MMMIVISNDDDYNNVVHDMAFSCDRRHSTPFFGHYSDKEGGSGGDGQNSSDPDSNPVFSHCFLIKEIRPAPSLHL